MSLLPIFVEYRPADEKRLFQVPVVCFDPVNDLAIIIHNKQFIKVRFDEIQFSRWDI